MDQPRFLQLDQLADNVVNFAGLEDAVLASLLQQNFLVLGDAGRLRQKCGGWKVAAIPVELKGSPDQIDDWRESKVLGLELLKESLFEVVGTVEETI